MDHEGVKRIDPNWINNWIIMFLDCFELSHYKRTGVLWNSYIYLLLKYMYVHYAACNIKRKKLKICYSKLKENGYLIALKKILSTCSIKAILIKVCPYVERNCSKQREIIQYHCLCIFGIRIKSIVEKSILWRINLILIVVCPWNAALIKIDIMIKGRCL